MKHLFLDRQSIYRACTIITVHEQMATIRLAANNRNLTVQLSDLYPYQQHKLNKPYKVKQERESFLTSTKNTQPLPKPSKTTTRNKSNTKKRSFSESFGTIRPYQQPTKPTNKRISQQTFN